MPSFLQFRHRRLEECCSPPSKRPPVSRSQHSDSFVVMGVIDAFVYAHNYHRRNLDNPANIGDCMEGRIRLMTAVTPTYAHAYSVPLPDWAPVCCSSPQVSLADCKARYPNLPNSRTTTREKKQRLARMGHYTDGGTRVSEGETSAGWSAVARSPHGRLYIMFGQVVTTEAHLAYARARHHSINTAELSSIIEALSFLGPMAQLPVILRRVSSTIPDMRPSFAWTLSKHARTSSWGSPAGVSCYKSNQGYELVCSTSAVMRRISETNVQTMPPLLVHTV